MKNEVTQARRYKKQTEHVIAAITFQLVTYILQVYNIAGRLPE